jgi:hypothetical protein
MPRVTEKELDRLFAAKFGACPDSRRWFLERTKFSGRQCRVLLLRADHPWYQSKKTGVQSETDILIVLEDGATQERFALHIENKLANGRYTPNQPQLYLERAEDWRDDPRYGSYDEYETVLIAPHVFHRGNIERSAPFHRFVAHEEIAAFIPEFGM